MDTHDHSVKTNRQKNNTHAPVSKNMLKYAVCTQNRHFELCYHSTVTVFSIHSEGSFYCIFWGKPNKQKKRRNILRPGRVSMFVQLKDSPTSYKKTKKKLYTNAERRTRPFRHLAFTDPLQLSTTWVYLPTGNTRLEAYNFMYVCVDMQCATFCSEIQHRSGETRLLSVDFKFVGTDRHGWTVGFHFGDHTKPW